MSNIRRTNEPHDPATELANTCLEAFQHHKHMLRATADGARAIVIVVVPGDRGVRCGGGHSGYDDDAQAIADMLMHARAVMRANGKDLQVVTMGDKPDGAQ